MADISYTRAVAFNDYIDGESVVSAGGSDGFNVRFHALEHELDAIASTFGTVNAVVKNVQQLQFVTSQPSINLPPNAASAEFEVEKYDRTLLPPNIDKVYFCVIFPVTGQNVIHNFLYHQIPGNMVRVSIAFFNPTAAPTTFGYRVLALAEQ